MNDNPSLGVLLKNLRDDTSFLVSEEIALAKTEISENISRTTKNVGYLAVGAFVALVALIMFLMGISKALAAFFVSLNLGATTADFLGYLSVAIIVGSVAGFLINKALNTLKEKPLLPEKTIKTLKEDKQWAQTLVQ